MSLFRTILIAFFVYYVFRYILGPIMNGARKQATRSTKNSIPNNELETHDKMLPCPTCGTYNASQMSFEKNGKFYCNKECYTQHT